MAESCQTAPRRFYAGVCAIGRSRCRSWRSPWPATATCRQRRKTARVAQTHLSSRTPGPGSPSGQSRRCETRPESPNSCFVRARPPAWRYRWSRCARICNAPAHKSAASVPAHQRLPPCCRQCAGPAPAASSRHRPTWTCPSQCRPSTNRFCRPAPASRRACQRCPS